jgi:hypothetical protein
LAHAGEKTPETTVTALHLVPCCREDRVPPFIDPRMNPQPPYVRAPRSPATHPSELTELLPLIRRGRVYDIEAWIRAGHPIHAETYQIKKGQTLESPMRAAIRSGQQGIALLLLCNGYPPAIVGDLWQWELLEKKKSPVFRSPRCVGRGSLGPGAFEHP